MRNRTTLDDHEKSFQKWMENRKKFKHKTALYYIYISRHLFECLGIDFDWIYYNPYKLEELTKEYLSSPRYLENKRYEKRVLRRIAELLQMYVTEDKAATQEVRERWGVFTKTFPEQYYKKELFLSDMTFGEILYRFVNEYESGTETDLDQLVKKMWNEQLNIGYKKYYKYKKYIFEEYRKNKKSMAK